MITVPAYRCLWSSEDSAAGHFRRYRMEQLSLLAKEAGFKVIYSSYFMQFLFVPILLVRVGMERVGILKKCADRTEKEKEKSLRSNLSQTIR